MGIPYYPYTSCKVGSFELGISLSEFMKLVDNGEIEISDRGGKHPFVNNDTLESCILKYGGRFERYNEFILRETQLAQKNEILKYEKLILSSAPIGSGRNNLKKGNWAASTISKICVNYYTGDDILEFSETIREREKNLVILKTLHNIGFTDNILNKYFKSSSFNYVKNKKQNIFLHETIKNVTFTLIESYSDFFNSYKVYERRYKQINFLTQKQKDIIVKKANKKFGY